MTLIIQCSEAKKETVMPARELYNSQLFRCALKYVDSLDLPWMILSGLYGLVKPDQLIAPYNARLRRSDIGAIREQLPGGQLISFCGREYSQILIDAGAEVTEPLIGLNVGQRKSWLLTHRGIYPPNPQNIPHSFK